jgi:hypothetical protein
MGILVLTSILWCLVFLSVAKEENSKAQKANGGFQVASMFRANLFDAASRIMRWWSSGAALQRLNHDLAFSCLSPKEILSFAELLTKAVNFLHTTLAVHGTYRKLCLDSPEVHGLVDVREVRRNLNNNPNPSNRGITKSVSVANIKSGKSHAMCQHRGFWREPCMVITCLVANGVHGAKKRPGEAGSHHFG